MHAVKTKKPYEVPSSWGQTLSLLLFRNPYEGFVLVVTSLLV